MKHVGGGGEIGGRIPRSRALGESALAFVRILGAGDLLTKRNDEAWSLVKAGNSIWRWLRGLTDRRKSYKYLSKQFKADLIQDLRAAESPLAARSSVDPGRFLLAFAESWGDFRRLVS